MLMGWELALGLAATFFGAMVLGTISFGLGTVAMPFLLLILMPRDAVVIVTAMIILTTGLTVAQTWRHLRLRETWPFVVAGLPPVPVGVFLLHEFNPTVLRVIIAVVVLAMGVMSLFSIRLPGARKPWMAPLVGGSTTFMVTTFAVGAPLAALYAIEQDWSRDTIRATLALYFLMAALLGMILFTVTGLVTNEVVQNVGVLAVAVLAGSGVAAMIARRISLRVFRCVVVAVTAAGSVSLLVREVLLAV
ncbi:MAG: sulfite exporter TauE/SafE family protein [Chloroflexota bacterium]|nr:sulfite exporter TauE/SafE family protein [Chloroflexota bacterium]